MGCKYVKDFEFPEGNGYSGSAGKTVVKGYARGGACKAGKHNMAKGGLSQAKVGKVMGEYKEGTLHSGKNGPVVTNPKQAVAIALSEARRGKKK